MLQSRTLSADESYWKLFELKAVLAGVTASALFRAMVEEFLLSWDLVKGPDDLTPKWVRKENGHA